MIFLRRKVIAIYNKNDLEIMYRQSGIILHRNKRLKREKNHYILFISNHFQFWKIQYNSYF